MRTNRFTAVAARALFALAAASVALNSAFAANVTSTWNGTTGDWTDATRWSPNTSYPNNGSGTTYDAVVGGGSVTLNQSIGVNSLSLSAGTITGSYNLTLATGGAWSGGTMSGNGSTDLAAGAVLDLSGGYQKAFTNRTININNTATIGLSGGSFSSTSGRVNNQSGGTFDVQGNYSLYGSLAVFDNAGLFKKSTGSGTATVSSGWTFNNTGAVQAQSGTLEIQGSGTSSGTFDVSNGAALTFSVGTQDLTGASFTNAGTLSFAGGTQNLAGTGSFSSPGTVNISGGTVNFNKPVTIAGGVNLSGGTLGGSDAVTIGAGNASTWTGGTMSGNGSTDLAAGAVLDLSGGYQKAFTNRTININNTATIGLSGGSFSSTSGRVNNQSGGTFDVQGNYSLYGSLAVFDNAGLFKKSTGSGTATVSSGWTFNNTGAVQAQSGTLEIQGSGTSSGTFDVSNGAALTFSVGTQDLTGASFTNAGTLSFAGGTQNLAGTGSFSSPGTVNISGGTVNFNKPVTIAGGVNLSGGTLGGSDAVTIGAGNASTWTYGTMSGNGSTDLAAGAVLDLSGGYQKAFTNRTININNTATIGLSGGSFSSTSGRVNNQSGGTFDVQGNYSLYGSLAVFDNAGLFKKSTGSGTATVSSGWTFNNTGAVQAQSGTLEIQGSGTSSGTFDVSNGAALTFSVGTQDLTGASFTDAGTLSFAGGTQNLAGTGSFSSPGTVNISGGTVNFNKPVTIAGGVNLSGGTLGGSDAVTIGAGNASTWTYGTMSGNGSTDLAAGAVLDLSGGYQKAFTIRTININNAATITLSGGSFSSTSGRVNNQSGGTFDVQGDYSLYGSLAVFDNAGLFKKSGGIGTSTVNSAWAFNNTGTVQAKSGTLEIQGSGTSPGTFEVDSVATLNFAGGTHDLTGATFTNAGRLNFNGATANFNGPTTVTGAVNFSGGTLGGSGALTIATGSTWNWTYGTMSGNGSTNVAADAVLNLSGGNQKAFTIRTININNAATITLSGGSFSSTSGRVNNQSGGTFDLQGDLSLNASSAVFDNAGLFKKSTGSGTATVYSGWTFNNTGTVQAQSGTLQFYGAFYQTAGSTDLAGGSLAFSSPAQISGGQLLGAGTITGSVNNSGGLVSPGHSAGSIAVTGNYTQDATGALLVELGGPASGQFDFLSINGKASLAGTLEVGFLNDFRPALGDTFNIMNFNSRSGDFGSLQVLGAPGYSFATQYSTGALTLVTLSVPEPGSLTLLLTGATAALFLAGRRRKR